MTVEPLGTTRRGTAAVHLPYRDRSEAGRVLATHLTPYAGPADVLVLAVPRGGVPVGVEVARRLDADVDIIVVRKLGAPQQPELAMGAIGLGGVRVLNAEIIALAGVSARDLERVAKREERELRRREELYRGDCPPPRLRGRTVILVDDGLATGATMEAAVAVVRHGQPSRVVVAVPVAPPDAVESLAGVADEVVCPATPWGFTGVGAYYTDFAQLSDLEVQSILENHR